MKRLVLTAAIAVLAAFPAAAGLIGNASFGESVPVRIPARASLINDQDGTENAGAPTTTTTTTTTEGTTSSTTSSAVSSTEDSSSSSPSSDDNSGAGANSGPGGLGDDNANPGGGNQGSGNRGNGGPATEPGDDRGGQRSTAATEPTQDNSGPDSTENSAP